MSRITPKTMAYVLLVKKFLWIIDSVKIGVHGQNKRTATNAEQNTSEHTENMDQYSTDVSQEWENSTAMRTVINNGMVNNGKTTLLESGLMPPSHY